MSDTSRRKPERKQYATKTASASRSSNISLDEYNSSKETEYIMSSPATMDTIRKGEEDINNGNLVAQNVGEGIKDFLKRIACAE